MMRHSRAGHQGDLETSQLLREDYGHTLNIYRELVNVRFRLLAFVPTVSAAGIGLLRAGSDTGLAAALGVFGAVVTMGVVFYEIRNSLIHDRAIHRLKFLEQMLAVPPSEPKGRIGGHFGERGGGLRFFGFGEDSAPSGLKHLGIMIWHDRALAVIYGSVLAGWIWLAVEALRQMYPEWLGWRAPNGVSAIIAVAVGLAVYREIRLLAGTGRPPPRIVELAQYGADPRETLGYLCHVMRALADGRTWRRDRAVRQRWKTDVDGKAIDKVVNLAFSLKLVEQAHAPLYGERWRATEEGATFRKEMFPDDCRKHAATPDESMINLKEGRLMDAVVGMQEVCDEMLDPQVHADDNALLARRLTESYGQLGWITPTEVALRKEWLAATGVANPPGIGGDGKQPS